MMIRPEWQVLSVFISAASFSWKLMILENLSPVWSRSAKAYDIWNERPVIYSYNFTLHTNSDLRFALSTILELIYRRLSTVYLDTNYVHNYEYICSPSIIFFSHTSTEQSLHGHSQASYSGVTIFIVDLASRRGEKKRKNLELCATPISPTCFHYLTWMTHWCLAWQRSALAHENTSFPPFFPCTEVTIVLTCVAAMCYPETDAGRCV